ncbi:Ser/Thr protein kinase RdoA involved in Cpx stress response, MazF antagonist [Cribrihabitans marinus]|uniref:Ser/Thr protein kinase RdoA involved in Cpx stress response, MazF antagonist n=1 Tax=Cribrihabitans marinus TaxID=1227549 RepID=A0A1H7DP01_9RHOB|nr:phosphotransferase [Cribrihabitans marinus]SEK03531.1 Ser/Thr protein kinase RdoA involved in Cpx stress response, MazF antagonist [Cribrihabitans marinus]
MLDRDLPLDTLLDHLHRLARSSLHLWAVPDGADIRLINVSENVTFLVEAPDGFRAVLRAHREDYHSRRAIDSELAWLRALDADGAVPTPRVYAGRDGRAIQTGRTPGLERPRFMVLFHFIEGHAPDEDGDLTPGFEELGALAARCHQHVLRWPRPEGFERLTWDTEAVFGPAPTWGDWRDAPNLDGDMRVVLERVERVVRARLDRFGKAPDRYNLIHADMRLANLLVGPAGTRVIDFDDCGMGWFLYDFAAAISFIEDDPRIPALKSAWLRGYRTVRALSPEEEAEIDTFVMLRRMALLAWIGSHIEAPEPQQMAPTFAAGTAELGRAYLARFDAG